MGRSAIATVARTPTTASTPATRSAEPTPADNVARGSGPRSGSARNVPRTARPTAPPSWRKNPSAPVAAPSAVAGTAFWTTTVNTENVGPNPRPATIIQTASV